MGVEEELMLVDLETWHPIAISERALLAVDRPVGSEVCPELFRQQIETSTPPVENADDLRRALQAGRRAVGEAAAAAGARAVAVAAPVVPTAATVTSLPRYERIGTVYGQLAGDSLVCAMHTHVAVADDDEGVAVIDAIRPWLPVLLAVSSNSPYLNGRDTGYASWRSLMVSRWPTAGPQQPFGDAATYRRVAARLLATGAGLDAGTLAYDVRLSATYPTVEVRVADVCTDLDDTVLIALLTRGLVDTAAHAPTPGTRSPDASTRTDVLRAAAWRAARYGLTDRLVHPRTGRLAPARDVLEATVQHARAALEETADHDTITALVTQVLTRGTGATAQRRTYQNSGGELARVVADLASRTEQTWL
jgi:carboxylate-amine ligase